ncbi:MAG: hypothetical protein ACYTG0_42225, partial [Planctomycetota bacterium]|jgi:general secretion pathway protein A
VGVDGRELVWFLTTAFGLNPNGRLDLRSLWRLLSDRLIEYQYRQLETVVLFDDADQASPDALTQVMRLAHFERTADSRLTIVLAGRDEGIGRLGHRLLELAELRIDVRAWERNDTEDYLRSALAQAGRQSPAFVGEAVDRLHRLARGVPRRISQLADLALLAGAGRKLEQVDADTVESVYHELGVVEA